MEYGNFTKLYPVQKTLRFELRPQGKTMDNLQKTTFFDDDVKRADQYSEVKKIIDDAHREFIDESLSRSDIDWGELYNATNVRKEKRDDASKKELSRIQDVYCGKVANLFEWEYGKNGEHVPNEKFKALKKESIPKYVSKNILENGTDDEKAALGMFNRFSMYFRGLLENRKNMYSSENKASTVAKRAVCDNFQRFCDNCERMEIISREMPEIIARLESEMAEYLNGEHLTDLFSVKNYNRFLSQRGIDLYNTLIGGYTDEVGMHIGGLNGYLNEEYQKPSASGEPKKRKLKLDLLYKQVLSIRTSASYIPRAFENDSEMLKCINMYLDDLKSKDIFSAV